MSINQLQSEEELQVLNHHRWEWELPSGTLEVLKKCNEWLKVGVTHRGIRLLQIHFVLQMASWNITFQRALFG